MPGLRATLSHWETLAHFSPFLMRMRRGNARLLRDCPAAGMRRRKCASRMSLPNFFKALFTGIGVSNLLFFPSLK